MTESDGACPACGGSGGGPFGPAGSAWDDEAYRCPRCKGLGIVAVESTSVAPVARPLARPAPLAAVAAAPPLARRSPVPPAAEARGLARTRPAKRARAAAAGLKKQ